MIPFTIRDAAPSDEAFIQKSWKLQMAASPLLDVFRNKTLVFAVYSEPLDALYARSTVRVACAKDDADAILGYVVTDPTKGLIHFVYVKSVYRRFGIATALLAEFQQCKAATTWSAMVEDIAPSRGYSYTPSRVWPNAKADRAPRGKTA